MNASNSSTVAAGSPQVSPAATIYVRTWSGSGSARVVEMNNAGKRGKRCRVLRFSGWFNTAGDRQSAAYRAHSLTAAVVNYLAELAGGSAYMVDGTTNAATLDEVRLTILAMIAEAGDTSNAVHLYDEECRGVDAPKVTLTAGVDGVWSGSVGDNGIYLADLTDQHNDPRIITPHDQANNTAYALASKVWGQVQAAKTFSEVQRILSDAGCRLHYYCAMD
jgi:hypothetical protein